MEIKYSRSCENISSLFSFSKKFFKFSWRADQIQDHLTDKNSVNYFAYYNEELVGYILFNLNEYSKQAHLYQVCVNPEFRSQGIGQKLIILATNAMQDNCDSVFLEVEANNTIAIRFYENLGLEKLNKIPSFYSDGSDAYAMHVLSSKLAKQLKN